MLFREKYINKIIPFIDSELIKVLTGMRRSGKSIILKQLENVVLKKGVKEENIIFINFESMKYRKLLYAESLYEYISNKIKEKGKYYLFFDEIQFVKDFERVLNSIRVDFDVSVFVTGSNANLLSGELATILSGRYVKFNIFPFTFKEYVEYNKLIAKKDKTFIDYLMYGGMPQVYNFENDIEKQALLIDILDSIVYRDILMKLSVKNVGTVKKFIDYVVQSTALDFNASSIAKYLKSERISVSTDTIYTYLDAIINSMIVRKCQRYDIKGKKLLKRNEKYYVADMGLRNHTLNLEKIDFGACMETIVYNQLVSDGYEVNVGKIKDYEIDFIATKPGEKKYIQVCYLLANEEIVEREFRGLEMINDNFEKYVISYDKVDHSKNGIKHINIIDYLTMKQ